jgi:hypothetical protein
MENNKQQKSPFYSYGIKNFLTKDSEMFREIGSYSKIYLCIYRINTNGKYPFLQFLLSNNGYGLLNLPNLPLSNSVNNDNLFLYSKVFLSGILNIAIFEDLDNDLIFDGFYEYKENLYMFFDITKFDINIDETYSSSHIRFALVDEIVNHKNVCNIPITSEINDFFIKNESINFIFDENNEKYETPIVGYVGKKTPEQLNFTYIFGEPRQSRLHIFGSNYYFTDLKNAIKQAGWSNNNKPEYLFNKLITDNENGRYIKGGVVRFALFTGKTKYIENNIDIQNDDSYIKRDRLNDTTLNSNYEKMTLRISDHDSIWTKTHDSLYLGKIELDDGSFIKESPIIVTSSYNQQVSLSFHYLNKSKLGNTFNSHSDYTIL